MQGVVSISFSVQIFAGDGDEAGLGVDLEPQTVDCQPISYHSIVTSVKVSSVDLYHGGVGCSTK